MRQDASTHSAFDAVAVTTALAAVLGMQGRRDESAQAPWLVGVSGLQGCGKSTFAHQFGAAANAQGVRTVVLALDDFYLGRRERAHLARSQHPLLMTRGVPGTHDVGLLGRTLDALAHADAQPIHIPRFDKGLDTRLPPSRWRRIDAAPRLIVLEGWCIGVPPQRASELTRPLNALEHDDDRDGRWRRWVNAQLGGAYTQLWQRIDQLILLQAPDFAVVARWREQQERALRVRHAPHAMDGAALERFLMHYERLSRHALRELPQRADLRLRLGRNREVREVR